jgi:hypothetical protein
MDDWTPSKGDVCRPRFKAIEGNYFLRISLVEDGVVTFSLLKNGKPVGVHTNYITTFIHRFELYKSDNVVCIESYRQQKKQQIVNAITI